MSRLFLFLATNMAVMLLLSITMKLFGLDYYLASRGMQGMDGLLIFSALLGFGGAFVSLAISKWMAKRSMGVKILENPSTRQERWLVETIKYQAQKAGIGMPEVGVFNSPEPNAFATGMSRNNALIAVSTGLLQHMSQDEVEAVLGHEVSHVANGDMITMGLLQGILNTFVIFLSRIIGMFVDKVILKNNRGTGIGFYIVSFIAEIILGILASFIAAWFSRRREYRADEGGAELAGKHKMIAVLRALQRVSEPQGLPEQVAAFGILGGTGGIRALMRTHPPLEERIKALEVM